MRVLVTGGAGYIGSVVTRELLASGHEVVVFDNLCTGHRAAVPAATPFVLGDTRDITLLQQTFSQHDTEAVIHMAAISQVGTSVVDPRAYFENNVGGALSLFGAMLDCGIHRLVFSSTAAVYGEPDSMPITELAATRPTSPYGDSKLVIETVLSRYDAAYGLRSACLRYFNAAGAVPDAGEDHRPETHLVPLLLDVAAGKRADIAVFGTDYPTPDGTCVRDYIHVADLARAHVLALDAIDSGSRTYNLGCGGGFSVAQVVEAVRRITGHAVPVRVAPRRAGDPAELVASSARITAELGWMPEHPSIDAIVQSAWDWRRANPNGYGQ